MNRQSISQPTPSQNTERKVIKLSDGTILVAHHNDNSIMNAVSYEPPHGGIILERMCNEAELELLHSLLTKE